QRRRSQLGAAPSGGTGNRVETPIRNTVIPRFGELDETKRDTCLFDDQQMSVLIPHAPRIPLAMLGGRNLVRIVHPASYVRMIPPAQHILQIIFAHLAYLHTPVAQYTGHSPGAPTVANSSCRS